MPLMPNISSLRSSAFVFCAITPRRWPPHLLCGIFGRRSQGTHLIINGKLLAICGFIFDAHGDNTPTPPLLQSTCPFPYHSPTPIMPPGSPSSDLLNLITSQLEQIWIHPYPYLPPQLPHTPIPTTYVSSCLIGVCIDTNVIYQSVLEKKTYWSYISQKT